jgi:uroporphyrin-III C-methyltransferase
LAQADSGNESTIQPIGNPSADTLVYYMGRKDAAKIAQQLIVHSPNQTNNTPVQILEAVSTQRERQWSSTLGELALGKADSWFDSSSPALIMIGEALRISKVDGEKESQQNLERSRSKIDNSLQDSRIFSNGRRCA